MKKTLFIIIAIVLVVGVLFVLSYFSNTKTDVSGIILFYGDGCPHCEIVDDFINENKVKEKVRFIELEVFNNEENQKIWLDKVNFCKLNSNDVGVPFLWDGKNCLMGDIDIINFFQEKLK